MNKGQACSGQLDIAPRCVLCFLIMMCNLSVVRTVKVIFNSNLLLFVCKVSAYESMKLFVAWTAHSLKKRGPLLKSTWYLLKKIKYTLSSKSPVVQQFAYVVL